jgi:excisionase family DNA binding protein
VGLVQVGLQLGTVTHRTNTMNTEKEILDVKGAAQLLGCSVAHISNMLNGKVDGVPPIPHVRAGRRRLIRRASLMAWFAEQEDASNESVKRISTIRPHSNRDRNRSTGPGISSDII